MLILSQLFHKEHQCCKGLNVLVVNKVYLLINEIARKCVYYV